MAKPRPPRQETQPFDGRAAEMRDSQWLATEDIDLGRDITVTIASINVEKNVQFDDGRTQKRVYSLSLVGKEKKLLLNASRRKSLVALYGGLTSGWVGKRIALYCIDLTRPMGQHTRGYRIRDQEPPPPKGPPVNTPPLPSDMPPRMTRDNAAPPDEMPTQSYHTEGGHEPDLEPTPPTNTSTHQDEFS